MHGIVQFHFPTIIRCGIQSRKEIAGHLQSQKISRPLVVTDENIAKLEFFSEVVKELEDAGLHVGVYSGVIGNPVVSQVENGMQICRSHKADGVLIVGGGAALDVGKVIALLATNAGEIWDYEDVPGAKPVENAPLYTVAMPTTAGTGSEVGRSSVISNDDDHKKRIVFHPSMLPDLVIVDPEVTVGLPQGVTAATGFDALTHNIEALIAKGYHPMAEGIAMEGIRLVKENLLAVLEDGNNIDARGNMLVASLMGAVAFQKGLGVTHSCAHALSTHFDTHHGLANAIMLEACMRFNMPAAADKMARAAAYIGVGSSAEDFCQWIRTFKSQCGLDQSFTDLGIEVSDSLVETAFADPVHGLNPRSVTQDDFRDLFHTAMKG